MSRLGAVVVLAVRIAALVAGCGHATPASPHQPVAIRHRDRPTVQALLRIARRFNHDYAANDDGPVYDRWDAPSQAVISRAEYVRRHQECRTAPGAAIIEDATRVSGGYWTVRYSIAGNRLTDYWHYEHGRWLFDLLRSNAAAVRLYRLPAAKYLAAVGCTAQH